MHGLAAVLAHDHITRRVGVQLTYDRVVSRYLNGPLSRPAARALHHTRVTPNAVTLFALLLAAFAGAIVGAGWNILGGIAIQAVSVADSVDGELARLRERATRFGALLDTVADRYVDAAILAGMTVYAVRFEDVPGPEVVGMLALGAALVVSYSRARIEADILKSGDLTVAAIDGILGLAGRDVRLLVAAIGTILGQCYWALAVLAAASVLTVAWRLLYLRLKGMGAPAALP